MLSVPLKEPPQSFEARHQRIVRVLFRLSGCLHKQCDDPSAYTSNPPLLGGVNLVYEQHHLDSLKMACHEQITQEDETRLAEKWWDEIFILDQCKTHKDEVLQLLHELQDIWNGLSDRTRPAKQRIDLTFNNVHSDYSALYRPSKPARKFSAKEIQEMPRKEVIELASTERTISIVFVSKMNGSLRFCSDYRKLKEVTVNNLHRTKDWRV